MSKKLLVMSVLSLAMLVGMSTSVAALETSSVTTDRGYIIADFSTANQPDTAEVYVDGELRASLGDGVIENSNTDFTAEIEAEAREHDVEIVTIVDGNETSETTTVEVVDFFTYGEDVNQELSVSINRDSMVEGLGLYQEPTTLNQDVTLDDGTELEKGTRVMSEAYSKIALVEGNLNQDNDVEVIWEGTPSILPSNDPWEQVHPDTTGEVSESHTFAQTLYDTGEYSYVVYLASAVTEYDQLNDEWSAPSEEASQGSGTYSIYEEDKSVYPFQIVEPEEPPSALDALSQFLDQQLNSLFNLFR